MDVRSGSIRWMIVEAKVKTEILVEKVFIRPGDTVTAL
jgi:hypothetical protein